MNQNRAITFGDKWNKNPEYGFSEIRRKEKSGRRKAKIARKYAEKYEREAQRIREKNKPWVPLQTTTEENLAYFRSKHGNN